jgi:hypothetical protein
MNDETKNRIEAIKERCGEFARSEADFPDVEGNEYMDDCRFLIAEIERLQKLVAAMQPDHSFMCLRRGDSNEAYIKKFRQEYGIEIPFKCKSCGETVDAITNGRCQLCHEEHLKRQGLTGW